MPTAIKIGQKLKGKLASYLVSTQVAKNVWIATYQNQKVVIKTAPKFYLENERTVLRHFQGRPCIRQILDEINDPPSMVLQHLDDNSLAVCSEKPLEGLDVKYVAKRVLQALQALHEEGYTHTDVKPDNILVNFRQGPPGSLRFTDVVLSDFGDVSRIEPEKYLKVGESGPHIGAAIFRSPEAMLKLRWGTSTDIWSFGATLISLIWGLNFHIFKPETRDATFDDKLYLMHVMVRQVATFGPVPTSYVDLIADEDEDRWEAIGSPVQFVMENDRMKPFALATDGCLRGGDREFILRIMKFDPRDRPTAGELLGDKWFLGVA